MPANIGVCPITIPVSGEVQAHRFVGTDNALAGAGANTVGVSASYGKDEDTTVDTLGLISVEAGGVVTAGGLVKSDASGRAIDQGGTGVATARALDSAAAAGEYVRCILIPN